MAQRLGGEHRGLAARAGAEVEPALARRATGAARLSASAASCEPSSCTRRRPPEPRIVASGSPPPRRKPIGEYGVRRASSGTSARSGSAAIVTRGAALSAVEQRLELVGASLGGERAAEGAHDPHRVREEQAEALVVGAGALGDPRHPVARRVARDAPQHGVGEARGAAARRRRGRARRIRSPRRARRRAWTAAGARRAAARRARRDRSRAMGRSAAIAMTAS